MSDIFNMGKSKKEAVVADTVQLSEGTRDARTIAPWWVPDTRTGIAYWMCASTFALIVLMIFGKVPSDNQMVSMAVSAYITTGFITVLNWWFSSSKGSDDKTQAIIQQGEKK